MINIHYLSREHLDTYWPHIKDFLQAGLYYSEDELDIGQVRILITQGHFHIIVAIDPEDDKVVGALCFEIKNYPNFRAAHIVSLGGDHLFLDKNHLIHLREELRRAGIHRLEGLCKPAQARLLVQKLGATVPYQMVRINLEEV